MKDQKGYLAIIDGMIAILILFSAFLMFNLMLEVPDTSYTVLSHENTKAQNILQQLSTNINVTDRTFLEEISAVLDRDDHSKRSIREISALSEVKLKQLGLEDNYLFTETNVGFDILKKGNHESSPNLSVASRNCGRYCFRLYVW